MKEQSSDYILDQRREYSLYTLYNRALPFASDGLKAAARRVLWMARDEKKHKSASLAGITMPIHPHQSPEGVVNTLAAPYTNNIPLLHGIGSFGTLMNPKAYGASRYTSVKLSEFTKDVIFRDIELVPMKGNYDNTQKEPKHFIPLIPTVLLNRHEGVAVGFATNIHPRDLGDIIKHQIMYLKGNRNKISEPPPTLRPINQVATHYSVDKNGNTKWFFRGEFEKINATTIKVTNLPYGIKHEKYIDKLYAMQESGTITNIVDNSSDHYDIVIRFKKGTLSKLDEDKMYDLLQLETSVSENLNVIDFDENSVWSTNYVELICDFTEWRLKWYMDRYQRLIKLLAIDIQRYKDIITAIRRNIGSAARKVRNRSELKEFLTAIKIVHVDYIADLPVYRFTEDEKDKIQKKLDDAEILMKEYQEMVSSEDARRAQYVKELQDIQRNYKKGKYNV